MQTSHTVSPLASNNHGTTLPVEKHIHTHFLLNVYFLKAQENIFKEKVANILTKISPQFHLSTSRILLQSCEFFKVTFKNVSKSQFQRHNFKLINLKKNFHEKIRFLKVNVTKPIIWKHVLAMHHGSLLCLFLMEANSSRTVWSVDLAKASAVAQYPWWTK